MPYNQSIDNPMDKPVSYRDADISRSKFTPDGKNPFNTKSVSANMLNYGSSSIASSAPLNDLVSLNEIAFSNDKKSTQPFERIRSWSAMSEKSINSMISDGRSMNSLEKQNRRRSQLQINTNLDSRTLTKEELRTPSPVRENKLNSLQKATFEDNLKKVRKLVIEKDRDVNKLDSYHQVTALHIAAEHNRIEIAKTFLDPSKNFLTRPNFTINMALKTGDLSITNPEGRTPLLLAVKSGHVNMVRLLLESKADINATDKFGCGALHYSIISNDWEMFSIFLEKKIRLDIIDKSGNTLLHHAIEKCNEKIALALIQYGHSVNTVNWEGKSPLHTSVIKNLPFITKVLLSFGAVANALDVTDKTAGDYLDPENKEYASCRESLFMPIKPTKQPQQKQSVSFGVDLQKMSDSIENINLLSTRITKSGSQESMMNVTSMHGTHSSFSAGGSLPLSNSMTSGILMDNTGDSLSSISSSEVSYEPNTKEVVLKENKEIEVKSIDSESYISDQITSQHENPGHSDMISLSTSIIHSEMLSISEESSISSLEVPDKKLLEKHLSTHTNAIRIKDPIEILDMLVDNGEKNTEEIILWSNDRSTSIQKTPTTINPTFLLNPETNDVKDDQTESILDLLEISEATSDDLSSRKSTTTKPKKQSNPFLPQSQRLTLNYNDSSIDNLSSIPEQNKPQQTKTPTPHQTTTPILSLPPQTFMTRSLASPVKTKLLTESSMLSNSDGTSSVLSFSEDEKSEPLSLSRGQRSSRPVKRPYSDADGTAATKSGGIGESCVGDDGVGNLEVCEDIEKIQMSIRDMPGLEICMKNIKAHVSQLSKEVYERKQIELALIEALESDGLNLSVSFPLKASDVSRVKETLGDVGGEMVRIDRKFLKLKEELDEERGQSMMRKTKLEQLESCNLKQAELIKDGEVKIAELIEQLDKSNCMYKDISKTIEIDTIEAEKKFNQQNSKINELMLSIDECKLKETKESLDSEKLKTSELLMELELVKKFSEETEKANVLLQREISNLETKLKPASSSNSSRRNSKERRPSVSEIESDQKVIHMSLEKVETEEKMALLSLQNEGLKIEVAEKLSLEKFLNEIREKMEKQNNEIQLFVEGQKQTFDNENLIGSIKSAFNCSKDKLKAEFEFYRTEAEEKIKNLILQMDNKISQHLIEKNSTDSRIELLQKEILLAEDEAVTLDEENQQILRNLNLANENIEIINGKINQLQNIINENKKKLDETEKEIQSGKENLEVQVKENEISRRQLEQAQHDKLEKQAKISDLETKLENTIHQSNLKIEKAHCQLKTQEEEFSELKNSMELEISKLNSEIINISRNLDNQKSDNQIQPRIENILDSNFEANDEILSIQLKRLELTRTQMEEDIFSKDLKIEKLNETIKEIKENLNSKENKILELNSKNLTQNDEELAKREKKIQNLESLVAKYQTEIAVFINTKQEEGHSLLRSSNELVSSAMRKMSDSVTKTKSEEDNVSLGGIEKVFEESINLMADQHEVLSRQLENSKVEITAKEKKLEEIELENIKTSKKLVESQKALLVFEDDLKKVRESLSKSERDRYDLELLSKESEKNLKTKILSVREGEMDVANELRKKLFDSESEFKNYRLQILKKESSLEIENQILKTNLEVVRGQNGVLEKKIEKLSINSTKLQEKMLEQQQVLIDLRFQNEEGKLEVKNLNNEIEMIEQIQTSHKTNTAKQKNNLQFNLESAKDQLVSLSNEVSELEKLNSALKKKITEKDVLLNNSQIGINEFQNKLSKLHEKNENLQDLLKTVNSERQILVKESENWRSNIEEIHKEKDKLLKELQNSSSRHKTDLTEIKGKFGEKNDITVNTSEILNENKVLKTRVEKLEVKIAKINQKTKEKIDTQFIKIAKGLDNLTKERVNIEKRKSSNRQLLMEDEKQMTELFEELNRLKDVVDQQLTKRNY